MTQTLPPPSSEILSIIKKEWNLFTTTQNKGGRSACQDEKGNFYASRIAYWSMYSEEIHHAYLIDLARASTAKQNLISHKYAYMMAYTSPQEFKELQPYLPPVSPQKNAIVNAIMKIYLTWEISVRKTNVSVNNLHRPLSKNENSNLQTSVETYMTGELMSYSENTLQKILSYFIYCLQHNINPLIIYLEKLTMFINYNDFKTL